jgi:hypothetical protein
MIARRSGGGVVDSGSNNIFSSQPSSWEKERSVAKIRETNFYAEDVHDAHNKYQSLGIVLKESGLHDRERMVVYALSNPVQMVNMWHDASVGDYIYFVVKEVKNNSSKWYDCMGKDVGVTPQEDVDVNVVQFIPVTCKSSKVPYNNCGVNQNREFNGMQYKKEVVLKTKQYKVCTYALEKGFFSSKILFNNVINVDQCQQEPLEVLTMTDYGYRVCIGKVNSIYGKRPTPEEALQASRSKEAARKLWNNGSKISIKVKHSDTL